MTVSFLHPFLQDTGSYLHALDTIPANQSSQPVSVTDSPTSVVRQVITRQYRQEAVKSKPVQEIRDSVPFTAGKWNTSTNFLEENALNYAAPAKGREVQLFAGIQQKPEHIIPRERNHFKHDWLFGIFIFLIVLFVWIRVFYSKFFATLANALVSFQLSLKLFQERNVLSNRVSLVLNFIYIIVTTIFIFELIEYSGFAGTAMTGMNLFLLLLNIVMIYTVLRVMILRLTGSLFLVTPLLSEYIHNTFVINKGLGISLFPVVIMIHYLPYRIVPALLVFGVALYAIALLFKGFRAYQIIIRKDILIFYLVLYLCTLEILPLLLGYKFVISLIQSN